MENMSLKAILDTTQHAKENRHDIIARSSQLTAMNSPEGIVLNVPQPDLPNTETGFGLTEHAHAQMSEKLRIPKPYYDRMLKEGYNQLLATNINTWLNSPEMSNKKRMIRTLDGNVRALVSSKFKCLDNYDMMVHALERIQRHNGEIKQAVVNETNLYLKATIPSLNREVVQDDVIQAGLVLRNSEVGAGALRVEPMIYRMVCKNGMILPVKLREVHLGRDRGLGDVWQSDTREAESNLTWLKVRDMIDSTFKGEFLDNYVRDAQSASDVVLLEPAKVIDGVSVDYKISDADKKNIINHFMKSEDNTVWGIANSITRAAQEKPKIADQLELESIGYKAMIEIPKKLRPEDIEINKGTSR